MISINKCMISINKFMISINKYMISIKSMWVQGDTVKARCDSNTYSSSENQEGGQQSTSVDLQTQMQEGLGFRI